MKKTFFSLVALSAILLLPAASPAQSNIPELTEDEWWEKEGFGFIHGQYTQIDKLQGGGFALGGEYINKDTHFGAGGSFSMNLLLHDYKIGEKIFDYVSDAHDCDAQDCTLGLDFHIPARVSNSLTAYAGCGIQWDILSLDFRDGRSGGHLVESKAVKSFQTTESVFFGIRWRFFQHAYVFGEYRRDFGEVEVGDYYTYGSSTRSGRKVYTERFKLDMGDDRLVAGIGLLF